MRITLEINSIEDAIEAQQALARLVATETVPPKATRKAVEEEDADDDEDEKPTRRRRTAKAEKEEKPKRGGRRSRATVDDDDDDSDADEEDRSEQEPPKKATLKSLLDDDDEDEGGKAPQKTMADVKEQAKIFDAKYGTDKLIELLETKFGVNSFKLLPESKYNEAWAAMLFYGDKKGKGKD